MMKNLISATILLACSLLFPLCSYAVVIDAPGIHIKSNRVVHVRGDMLPNQAASFDLEMIQTIVEPGPRVVLINSDGGSISVGQHMLDMLQADRSVGIPVVCVVEKAATSMAFNLLTHCDVRLAKPKSHSLVHKVYFSALPPGFMGTAKNLRWLAAELDKDDEPYRQANAKAMHLTLKEYDYFADNQTTWTSEKLLKMRYLDGIVTRCEE